MFVFTFNKKVHEELELLGIPFKFRGSMVENAVGFRRYFEYLLDIPEEDINYIKVALGAHLFEEL